MADRGDSGRRYPPELTATLVREYAEGWSLNDLERKHGIRRQAIKRRLLKAGVTIRSDRRVFGPRNGRWSDNPTANAGRLRANHLYRDVEPCGICGTRRGPQRHHKDHDPTNNAPENVVWLCAECHGKYHRAVELVARVEAL